jgi:hypothetical protein
MVIIRIVWLHINGEHRLTLRELMNLSCTVKRKAIPVRGPGGL